MAASGVRASLRSGLRKVCEASRHVVLVQVWSLLLAAVLGSVLFAAIRTSIGSSLAGDRLRAGWDSLWYYGFAAQASGVASTLKPTVSGRGAVLDALDAFLDGFAALLAGGVGTGVLPAAILFLLSWTFFAGGFIARFFDPGSRFLERAGRFFPRLVVVAILGLVAYAAILGPLRGSLDAVREARLHDETDERVRFTWTLAEYLLLWALALLANLLLDYTKVFLVQRDEGGLVVGPARALGRAALLVARQPRRTIGLYLLTGLVALSLPLLYVAVAPGSGQSSAAGILAAFLAGQLYLLARVAARCLFWAGETVVVAELDAPEVLPEAA